MSLMKCKVASRLDLLGRLRTAYPLLATVASEWNGWMRIDERYPDAHPSFLKRRHDADQSRPMPLLLQYVPGDFNSLHQDLYGDLAFPMQVAILLSEPGNKLIRSLRSEAPAGLQSRRGRSRESTPSTVTLLLSRQTRRREFFTLLGGATVAWSFAGGAQQPSKLYRVGYLATARMPDLIEPLKIGLRELGYVEGKNLKVEYRFGGPQSERLDAMASELVELHPDAIVTAGTPATFAAKRATATIPIVMAPVGDPVRFGIVGSLAHPGGNITGVTMYGSELFGKRVELLKELLPAIARLGILGNAANPATQFSWKETQQAAQALGLEPALFTVREPNELTAAFAAMQRNGVDAVIVQADATSIIAQRQITTLAVEHRLPAIYQVREFVQDGGLISYGPSITEMTRRSAMFVDKILKGIKPTDLPIEQPTKFELAINLKTAKALGLTVLPSLLARADEVIE
jgi:putative tryptophan/tyrosine transport system substrate-binding protein